MKPSLRYCNPFIRFIACYTMIILIFMVNLGDTRSIQKQQSLEFYNINYNKNNVNPKSTVNVEKPNEMLDDKNKKDTNNGDGVNILIIVLIIVVATINLLTLFLCVWTHYCQKSTLNNIGLKMKGYNNDKIKSPYLVRISPKCPSLGRGILIPKRAKSLSNHNFSEEASESSSQNIVIKKLFTEDKIPRLLSSKFLTTEQDNTDSLRVISSKPMSPIEYENAARAKRIHMNKMTARIMKKS